LEIKYSDSFEKGVIETALYLQDNGLLEGPLLDGGFPNLKVFINAKPKSHLYSCYINKDSPFLTDCYIYFGTNE